MNRRRLLLVTDLDYHAPGRIYRDEDLDLATDLRRHFDLALADPAAAIGYLDRVDGVLFRNTGPVLSYRADYDRFRVEAIATGVPVSNSLDGGGDMHGKAYLLDLVAAGHPVIPTVARHHDLGGLPRADAYIVKPIDGADSIGIRSLSPAELAALGPDDLDGMLAQPRIEVAYEVSFTFLDGAFQYALHAPDPARRWELVRYDPTDDDLVFAQRFVTWNPLTRGIQRIDACRTPERDLLLMEIEDLNPYLSLDLLDAATRTEVIGALIGSLTEMMR